MTLKISIPAGIDAVLPDPRKIAEACLLAVIGNVLRIAFLCGLAALNVNDAIFGTCHDMAGYAVMFIEAMLLGSIFDRAST